MIAKGRHVLISLNAAVVLTSVMARAAIADDSHRALAEKVLERAGIKGGLVVHLGCGDGKLTTALRRSESYLVHGLDGDPANVARARAHIASLALYGKVSVDLLRGRRLPYVDDLVNLLVSEDPGGVTTAEVMRVLCPGGVAYIRRDDGWTKAVKPRPKDIGEWTHFLHDASGNAVAKDARVGPPRHMQWMAGPVWTRNHHTLASVSALVSAGGRTFCIVDEGPAASISAPARWFLVARDAFNGVLLWKRPIPTWAWHRRKFRSGAIQLPRTLVAAGSRVYVPLGLGSPVTALDAATGEVVMTYGETERAEEIVLHEGVLLVVTGSPAAEQSVRVVQKRRRRGEKKPKPTPFANEKAVLAIRAEAGNLLWKWSGGDLMPLTLAAAGRRVFFQDGKGVTCLDRDTGRELWRSGPPTGGRAKRSRTAGWSVATLVVHNGVVLWADGKRLSALSAETGKGLWECQCKPGFRSPADVFVLGGLVWSGPAFSEGRDLHTGEVKKTNTTLPRLQTAGHHHRCYRNKATDRYIMTGKRGIEFLDLLGDGHSRNNWIRGVCQYGVMPCNGLIYAPPHSCGCYMEAKLFGFWALAGSREPEVVRSAASPSRTAFGRGQRSEVNRAKSVPRLERGVAYGAIQNPKSKIGNPLDWPTYRHDALRSASTTTDVSAQLDSVWRAKVVRRANASRRLSAPVVADGIVVVSSIDTHRVVALDARDGKMRWAFTAGGRVDSPPTLYHGLALLGCADGWVYCLRASDGELVWRFRAAPRDRRTVALDQIESVWPVHGSVLVEDGLAYVAAGRSSYLDEGISLYGLDPRTGTIAYTTSVRSAHPGAHNPSATDGTARKKIAQNTVDVKTLTAPDRSDSFSMAGGATTDVLVSDGASIYMRQVRFDRKLARQEKGGAHLFSTSRLLDDSENHRSHWVLGTGDFSRIPVAYSWIANPARSRWGVRLAVPYGLLLAFDDKTVWGVRRRGGYMLFADGNRPFSANEEPQPDFRKANKKEPPAPWRWSVKLPMRPRAMLRAGRLLFVAGMPNLTGKQGSHAPLASARGGLLWVVSAVDGKKLAEHKLESPPVWDGMAAANGRLYVCTRDGGVTCMAGAD